MAYQRRQDRQRDLRVMNDRAHPRQQSRAVAGPRVSRMTQNRATRAAICRALRIARTDPGFRGPRSPSLAADPFPPGSHAGSHRPDLSPHGTARFGPCRHPDQGRRHFHRHPRRMSCARADRTCVPCCAVRRRSVNTRSNWRRNPDVPLTKAPGLVPRPAHNHPTNHQANPSCRTGSPRCWHWSPRG